MGLKEGIMKAENVFFKKSFVEGLLKDDSGSCVLSVLIDLNNSNKAQSLKPTPSLSQPIQTLQQKPSKM